MDILGTFSQDIPNMTFWQNSLEHVRGRARAWYQLLIDAGIVHLLAESAAAHVSNVWDDIEGWWDQVAVKNARIAFCDRYARKIHHPLIELKNILEFD
jgi:putative transferase (TIGR04331 family)